MKAASALLIALMMVSLSWTRVPERVFLRLIVVRSQTLAQELYQRVQAGESFRLLASRYSEDPSASRGGYLGALKLEQMNAAFREAVRGLGAGEVSQPFRLGPDYVLLYRLDHTFREHAYELQREGDRLLEEGKVEEALQRYQESVEVYPDFIHGYFMLAVAYSRKGDFGKEIEAYREAIRIEPGYHQAYYNLGLALLKVQDIPGALQVLKKAVEIKPDYTDALISLSAAYLSLGQLEEAREAARKAVEMNPLRAEGYYNLGAAESRRDPARALRYFDLAALLNPRKPEFKMALAVTYGQLGQGEKALEVLQGLVRDHPDFAPAREALERLKEFSKSPSSPP